ncbi:GNAT family N-acetyltransferase [Neobacillus piezotolerans]|uniref:GNAT family N-acetyltransferase n=1 Tax=Neobacillus piezotolerans TaxID=2259171 RepID=A0A3D8GPY1_9BACI|nr:GNAT family protein [Neobacillus piezotolerans]RDU36488.1 GNAT family N-acetyltransferase [Neobacillus piezotolerans]
MDFSCAGLIVGQNVILEPMEDSHCDSLWEAGKPTEIWAYMATKIYTKLEMEQAVETALAEKKKGTQFPFIIRRKTDGKIIGSTRYLDISPQNRSLEIGWTWLNPSAWRTSVNTECKYLLLKTAFEELGFNRVQLKTDGRNLVSQKAIERIGATKEGVLRQERKLQDGYLRDTVVYSILASEWPLVKAGLMKKLHESGQR